MATTAYQTVGFHFQVIFEGLPINKEQIKPVFVKNNVLAEKERQETKKLDVCFQSVSGLDVQLETENLKEGGENRFTHQLPGRSQFSSSLTLKRGLIMPEDSAITDWCVEAFVNLKVYPLAVVNVLLLDEKHEPLARWSLQHVWPKSWKVAELNAERSEVLIETLELNYNRFTYGKTK